MNDSRIALFPGSFDPFTKGHHDIVKRGLHLFDQIIIAIGYNAEKKRHFDIDFMVSKINETYSSYDNAEVLVYNELTASLAKKTNARFLLRGLRNTTDFEYENSIAQVNRQLFQGLETVFLITSPKYAFISSSIVRELHRYEADVDAYVPFNLKD